MAERNTTDGKAAEHVDLTARTNPGAPPAGKR
jgi:hypothetical protein